MSQDSNQAAPWYRRESWLVVCLVAFVPLLLGTVVTKGLQLALFSLSGVAFATSIVLLVRTDRTPPKL